MQQMWKDKTMMRRRAIEIIEELIHQFNHRITDDKPFQMNVERDLEGLEKLYQEHPNYWFKIMKSYLIRLHNYYIYWKNFIDADQFHHLEEHFMRYINRPDFTRNDLINELLYQLYQWPKITLDKTRKIEKGVLKYKN